MHDHEEEHHEELLKALSEEYSDILENSDQGIYIYLDDNHKLCNEKFASMLGFSVEEWSKPAEFIAAFVESSSGEKLVSAFANAMKRSVGTNLEVTWKKKDSGQIKTNVILVPISFQKHSFAIHFISEV